ncbi:enoyl-CoA hydratase/isomerase family protein [Stutzerimonas chloritidismutans]|uniref:enoyl-CoA hydratase/isomerase family protein n=1 Tax=Stutzerimonas chloritidismutans TaxID=203192 RepID=UPI003F18500D
METSDPPVLLSVRDGVASIVMNRPEQGNAIDLLMARALLHAAIACDQDENVRAVVLTANGKLFCAGGDLGSFVSAGDDIAKFLSELAGTFHLAISRLMRMKKPLVVLVNGSAAGAGMSLSLIGDIVLAERGAFFTAAYGAIGISPDGGLTWILPRLVGLRRAQEILLLNKRLSALQAFEFGLITRVVEEGALQAEGEMLARSLTSMNVSALGNVRELLLASQSSQLETQLELEARSIASIAVQPYVRSKVAAFVEQRSANNNKEQRNG